MVPHNIALHSVDTTSTLLSKLELGKDKTVHHNITSTVSSGKCVKKHYTKLKVEEAPNNS